MSHEVLLEGIAVLEHFEAIRAEEVPGVLVDHSEMAVHLGVERRAVLADLGRAKRMQEVL